MYSRIKDMYGHCYTSPRALKPIGRERLPETKRYVKTTNVQYTDICVRCVLYNILFCSIHIYTVCLTDARATTREIQ